MKLKGNHIGFAASLLLFLAIVPYSIIEWFDKSIPYSPALYILSAFSAFLLAFNSYNIKKD